MAADDETDAAGGRRVPEGPPSTAARNVVVGGCITLFVVALVGDSFLPVIFDRQPELFIALNARNRNLALAQPHLEWWAFFGIGATRLLLSDPLFFVLGRWYGDAGVRWIEKRSPTYGPMVRGAERWFGKAQYPLIVVAPNNYICLFAGASGMPVAVFAALNLLGTVGRLVVIWFFADAVKDQLDWVGDLISGNRLPFLALSVSLVVLSLLADRRSGGSEVGGLLHMDDEIAEMADEHEHGDDAVSGTGAAPPALPPTGDGAAPPTASPGPAPPDR